VDFYGLIMGEMKIQSSSRVECCKITDLYSANGMGVVLYYLYPIIGFLDVITKFLTGSERLIV
jgi:hypothetical protein